MARTFLTAQWRKLAMVNYEVAPQLLQPFVPAHTELDTFGGKHFVSLVGFMFQDTRLMGLKVPLHVCFEEVNLRFYVHHTGRDAGRKRGVVFIKEIVPRAALSFVANTFYGEHYETLPMRHDWQEGNNQLAISYGWKKRGVWQEMSLIASPKAVPIAIGSEEEFITEHFWGYTKLRNGRTSEYEVVHPRWDIYPVQSHEVAVDFGLMYGNSFGILNDATPASVLLAEGSEVTVRAGAPVAM